MTLDDLTVSFENLNPETLLEDWEWLIEKNKRPVLLTKAGDAFMQDRDTGAVYFLDIVEGKLEEVATSGDEFSKLLSDKNFVMDFFGVNLIAPLLKSGVDAPEGQLFGWKKPPVLGGEFESANLEATDIEVHFSIQGQIWEKVSNLPAGTNIKNIKFK